MVQMSRVAEDTILQTLILMFFIQRFQMFCLIFCNVFAFLNIFILASRVSSQTKRPKMEVHKSSHKG